MLTPCGDDQDWLLGFEGSGAAGKVMKYTLPFWANGTSNVPAK